MLSHIDLSKLALSKFFSNCEIREFHAVIEVFLLLGVGRGSGDCFRVLRFSSFHFDMLGFFFAFVLFLFFFASFVVIDQLPTIFFFLVFVFANDGFF